MSDPFNKLPTDPDWMAQVSAAVKEMGEKLKLPIVVVVIDPGGKLMVETANEPAEGHLADVMKEPTKLFATLAFVTKLQEAMATKQ